MKALVSLLCKSKINFSLNIFREESVVLSCNSVTYFSIFPLNNLKIEISNMKKFCRRQLIEATFGAKNGFNVI